MQGVSRDEEQQLPEKQGELMEKFNFFSVIDKNQNDAIVGL
jgi:hypothetical protein